MADDPNKQRSEADSKLEREIREGRKFTLAEAIGRMAGFRRHERRIARPTLAASRI